MEGTQARAPALLARVERSFAGSRVSRELLSRAFALVWRAPLALGGGVGEGVAKHHPAVRVASPRKGA